MNIDFQDQTSQITEEEKNILEKLILFTAQSEKIPENAEVSISFVDNEEIKALNNQYRNYDEVTDVLSFGMDEDRTNLNHNTVNVPIALGDIVIAVDRAREQAEAYNHSLMRELGFLTVHGLLHLLGYDHIEKEDEKLMFGKQTDILDAFGLER